MYSAETWSTILLAPYSQLGWVEARFLSSENTPKELRALARADAP